MATALMTPLCDPKVYNDLAWLATANSAFMERDELLDEAAALLARYDNKWGVCLVHRHCSLEQGEIMLADGNVTEPVVHGGGEDQGKRGRVVYPERWLSTGQAYEFTTRATEAPPAALFDEFRSLVDGGRSLASVLGLFHVPPPEAEGVWQVERTIGRRNIVGLVTARPVLSETMLEAAWAFTGDIDRPSYCQQHCNQDSNGNHSGSHHVIYG